MARTSLPGCCSIVGIASLILSSILTTVHASVYVDVPFAERVFHSVPYFNYEDTRWPSVDAADLLIGPITVLTPAEFDNFFVEFQASAGYTEQNNEKSGSGVTSGMSSSYSISPVNSAETTIPPPTFLLVEFGSSVYSSSIENIRHVAKWLYVDFVILIVNQNATWTEKLSFWWSQRFPGIPRDMTDRDGKIPTKLGECAFLGVGPKQGKVLMDMLNKFKDWSYNGGSQEFYFGIDGLTVMNGRSFTWRVGLYLLSICLFWRWASVMDQRELRERNRPTDDDVTYTGEELGMGEVQTSSSQHECCVCLEAMPHGEQVRILPCRHVFHHECINGWFNQHKFTCPMCKMDLKKHLAERRIASAELDLVTAAPKRKWTHRLWPWGRTIESLSDDQLIDTRSGIELVGGDLVLIQEAGVVV